MRYKKELPTYYYLTHFNEFLKFVKGPCAALLLSEHIDFIDQFETLSKDKQCLVVRSFNRKYPFIKQDSLYYPEINEVQVNTSELVLEHWFQPIQSDHIEEWLHTLTKDELYRLLSDLHCDRVLKSWSRPKLLALALTLPTADIHAHDLLHDYIVRNTDACVGYFLYLYFGDCHSRLNQFSMRDLGVMRTRKEHAQIMARFDSRETALSTYRLHRQLASINEQSQFKHEDILRRLKTLEPAVGERAEQLKNRALFKLSKHLIAFDCAMALGLLNDIASDEAQEKWVRESYKLGHIDAVEQRLESLIDMPLSDENLAFAEDFLARKYAKKRTSVLTDMLRNNSQSIMLDEMHKAGVEKGVVAYYKQRGLSAQRTENQLWRSLFGLTFWQEIFEIDGHGLVNEFDRMPLCLKKNQLYEIAQAQIDQKLNALQTPQQLITLVGKQAVAHYGKANDIFRWKQNLLALILPLIEHAPIESVVLQLKSMAQNWTGLNDGYPDIMVIDNGKLRFEEIKSEGDQLRRNQLLSIQKLKQNGFDVRITNVEWTIDPMQPYVVVDIETTGGRAQTHKITEIGMVKVINDQIVDEWQSLINPQRRIPANITALTGIDNTMVNNAPIFAEVAQQVADFTDDCVFVAHNVNFDYGFIREEFARLEQRFKRPKLCTVSQMRRHYKGLTSYSLANLTRHFGISMQRHHRAMSDAVAASELLSLINAKRLQKN